VIKYFVVDFETTGLNYDFDLPIEIGGLFCDENWIIEATINYLIKWPNLMDRDGWTRRHWKASTIHKIDYDEYAEKAVEIDKVVQEIINKTRGERPILVSDCIVFDWHWMKILLQEAKKDVTKVFHYCAWDTSLLFEASGVDDPMPAHRAFKDACSLYKAIIEALKK